MKSLIWEGPGTGGGLGFGHIDTYVFIALCMFSNHVSLYVAMFYHILHGISIGRDKQTGRDRDRQTDKY